MKQQAKPISIPTLCATYEKDPSQLRKMIKKLGIKTIKVRRPEDNRVVTAISDDDHQLLVDSFENLTAENAGKSFISNADAARELGYADDQLSNFARACDSYGFEIHKKKFDGRTQSCISRKDFNQFKKIRNAIAIVAVD